MEKNNGLNKGTSSPEVVSPRQSSTPLEDNPAEGIVILEGGKIVHSNPVAASLLSPDILTNLPARVQCLMDSAAALHPSSNAGELILEPGASGAASPGNRLAISFYRSSWNDKPSVEVRIRTVAGRTAVEALQERERELEQLSSARVEAHDEALRKIAKQMHDGVGQILAAIRFNVDVLEDTVGIDAEDKRRFEELKRLVDGLVQEAREMSYALFPSLLEDFGLVPSLQALCEQMATRSKIRATFQSHGKASRFDRLMEIAIYRIAQEALSNVERHSGAPEATVQLIESEDRLRLVVEDEGRGIDAGTFGPGVFMRGLGMIAMRERASRFSGTLTVDSSPNAGTVVTVEFPLEGRERT